MRGFLLPMKTILNYTPPSTDDLARLKDELGNTGNRMADLFALGGSHQWRKYTGGQTPRAMSAQMLFYACAMLELDQSDIDRVLARMRAVGASFDYDDPHAQD
ncbi:Uncharacterised protein [Achromobacter insolitus]|nr:hypothetical protein LMG6003_01468 [Achromobacter insolitus]VEG72317.1 Uncharacterised protein [Achromobacter insolitus]